MNEVPACFSVERDADGVLKILYQKPGRKFWLVLMNLFLVVVMVSLCWVGAQVFLFVNHSPYYSDPALPHLLIFPFYIVLMVGDTNIRLSNQMISLGEKRLEIRYLNLRFSGRRTIPKSDVQKLVQTRTVAVSRHGFDLILVDIERRLLLVGESDENTRWLGETLAEWAGVEFKATSEDGKSASISVAN